MFSQMAAISLIPNAVIDMVPLNESAIEYAKTINLKIQGLDTPLPREELIKRMASNDATLYVTYSECSPMLPLESFEVGVPCVTGNNHHYFENTELEKYIVINNEDDIEEIKEKIENCINEKDKLLKLYSDFKKKNDKESDKQVKDFIEG